MTNTDTLIKNETKNLEALGIVVEQRETSDNHPFSLYRHNGETFAFGIDPAYTEELNDIDHAIPRNPLEIVAHATGEPLDPASGHGKELLDLYADALIGHQAEQEGPIFDDLSGTELDMMLYMGASGNQSALEALSDKASKGKAALEAVQQQRLAQNKEREELLERLLKEGREHIKEVEIKDIMLVHATDHKPALTREGEVQLSPTEDVDNKSGRSSVHFALNHRVGSHVFGNWDDKRYTVIAPLEGVLKANPDALESLYVVDTYFVPDISQSLSMPGAVVLEAARDTDVDKWLGENGYPRFEPGMHYSAPDVDEKIEQISNSLGAESALHQNLPHAEIERYLGIAINEGRNLTPEETVSIIYNLRKTGPHTRRRVLAKGLLSGLGQKKYVFGPDDIG